MLQAGRLRTLEPSRRFHPHTLSSIKRGGRPLHLRTVYEDRVAGAEAHVDRAEGSREGAGEIGRLDVEEPEDFDPAAVPQRCDDGGGELALGRAVHDSAHALRSECCNVASVAKRPQEQLRASATANSSRGKNDAG